MDKARADAALRNKLFLEATLSAQLRMAVEDLAKMERTPGYVIDMGQWHDITNKDADGNELPKPVCAVCFAGVVISRRFGVPWGEFDYEALDDRALGGRQNYVMDGFNALREGEIEEALEYMELEMPAGLPGYVDVADYHDDAAAFKRDMLGLADMLQQHGM